MKSMLRSVNDHGVKYSALMFVCPGCALDGHSGLHILPVNTNGTKSPSWEWDGNLDEPTLSPSILTHSLGVCHSYLKAGVFQFLSDCTHELAGTSVPIPDLPEWVKE